jgi:uncharacterized protein (TIGR03067 family)
MTRTVSAALVLSLLVSVGSEAGDKGGKGDEKRIQGTWTVVSMEMAGKKASDEEIKDASLTFGPDGKLTINHMGKVIDGTYKLIPNKKPGQMDVTLKEGGEEKLHKAIYLLEKDSLKICGADTGEARPTEFATKEGMMTLLLVLKRGTK